MGDSLTRAQCLRINAFLLPSTSDSSVSVSAGVLVKPLAALQLRLNARHQSAREVAAGLGVGKESAAVLGVSRAELRPSQNEVTEKERDQGILAPLIKQEADATQGGRRFLKSPSPWNKCGGF